MLPTLEGVIARRVLLNFRADPQVCRRVVPEKLEIQTQNGFAIVGVCLIRLEHLRPKGFPAWIGLASENMAHRIAVRYPTVDGTRPGVFIWRRETNQSFVTLLGGRLFPGVHHRAVFHVIEKQQSFAMNVSTRHGIADVTFSARLAPRWTPTTAFMTFEKLSDFLKEGSCGFSCARRDGRLEGMELRTLKWELHPLTVDECHSQFYEEGNLFPRGSVEFDNGLLMRNVPHEWRASEEPV